MYTPRAAQRMYQSSSLMALYSRLVVQVRWVLGGLEVDLTACSQSSARRCGCGAAHARREACHALVVVLHHSVLMNMTRESRNPDNMI